MIRKQFILICPALILFILSIAGCATQTVNDSSSTAKGGQGETIISNQRADPSNLVSIITIKDSAFIPANLKIKSGSTVRFINQDSMTHAIKSESINSPSIGAGQSFEFTFESAGAYDYICGIHPSMKGRITVT
jgi:plastocyanin